MRVCCAVMLLYNDLVAARVLFPLARIPDLRDAQTHVLLVLGCAVGALWSLAVTLGAPTLGHTTGQTGVVSNTSVVFWCLAPRPAGWR